MIIFPCGNSVLVVSHIIFYFSTPQSVKFIALHRDKKNRWAYPTSPYDGSYMCILWTYGIRTQISYLFLCNWWHRRNSVRLLWLWVELSLSTGPIWIWTLDRKCLSWAQPSNLQEKSCKWVGFPAHDCEIRRLRSVLKLKNGHFRIFACLPVLLSIFIRYYVDFSSNIYTHTFVNHSSRNMHRQTKNICPQVDHNGLMEMFPATRAILVCLSLDTLH